MAQAVLPIELFELVIDLAHDPETWHSTSLVCKEWLTRSRRNLFRVVELHRPHHLERFGDLLSSAPHIAPCVQELAVSENSLIALLRPAQAIIARLPDSLSTHPLVRPTRLTVHNQLWWSTLYSPDYLVSLAHFSSSITSLDLFDVSFHTVADLSIILKGMWHIKSLSATHLDCQRALDPETSAAVGGDLPRLTYLYINSTYPTSVIDWLIQHNSFPSLRDAEIVYDLSPVDAHQGLGSFWESTGPIVENLSLTISKKPAGVRLPLSVLERHLNLSSCTALRTLRLDCRRERELVPDLEWLIWLLSRLHSPALREVSFTFQNSSHALATLNDFATELDSLLADLTSTALPSLESVAIEFEYRSSKANDPDEVALLSKFPALQKTGMLRVSASTSR